MFCTNLSNDPGNKGSNFFCYGTICFPHIERFSFSHIECINLQKGSLRNKIYFNSIFKGVFCVNRFQPIIRLANNGQENFTILKCSSHRISTVLLRLRQDFVIRKLVRREGINIHAALWRFCKIWCFNQSDCSRDNKKVITFFAFRGVHCIWFFPSYLDNYFNNVKTALILEKSLKSSGLLFIYHGWISSVSGALDYSAEGPGFNSWGQTNTQGPKITENEGTSFALQTERPSRGSDAHIR